VALEEGVERPSGSLVRIGAVLGGGAGRCGRRPTIVATREERSGVTRIRGRCVGLTQRVAVTLGLGSSQRVCEVVEELDISGLGGIRKRLFHRVSLRVGTSPLRALGVEEDRRMVPEELRLDLCDLYRKELSQEAWLSCVFAGMSK
jgi:hypothetical protein